MPSEIKAILHQISSSTSEAVMGKHRVLVDRPTQKGGADLGPMGGELFLGAIGGCFMSNFLAAIKSREAQVTDIAIEVIGTIIESPARFAEVEVRITATGDQQTVEHLATVADRGCIMMNTLRDKIPVSLGVSSRPLQSEAERAT